MIDIDDVLAKYSKVEQREYQIACIKDIVKAFNDKSDILIDLPTGAGKTMVFSPIAANASEKQLRTLVLTATKQAQRRVGNEIDKFLLQGKAALVFGMQEYDCPLLKRRAEPLHCREQKEQCRKLKIECDVIKSDKEYNERSLVVSNFSKFLLARMETPYDIIILDDSHSFENSKEQAYHLSIQGGPAKNLYEAKIGAPKLQDFLTDFMSIYSQVFSRCINPGDSDGPISQEYISQLSALTTTYDMKELEQEIAKLQYTREGDIYWNIYYFVTRCSKSSEYQFFVRVDWYDKEDFDSSELISIKEDIGFLINKRFGNSSIAYATATPGDAIKHASTCSLRDYREGDLRITPSRQVVYPEIENWFEKLRILVVTDIGDTRETDSFNQAIGLTTDILTNRSERALVLFKNYRDQKKANDKLAKIFAQNKLFFIDSSIQESDFVEDLASRSQISLASASSTLWEGINIKDLRIAVVVTAPFIRPPIGKKSTHPDERRMLIRLQQGIGRIIRHPSDFGIAVLMDNRFDKYVRRRAFDKRMFKQVQFVQSKDVLGIINETLTKGEH
ncbi:MAG: DEAD/DEAH box helicase family protein [Candidatus Bathyarchaeota archaeon]|nr:DEAD/DEAH box helicase family protein [Candidatus Bathyarchaeota archaeon]